MDTPRHRLALLISIALHALFVLLLGWETPARQPQDRVLELAFVRQGQPGPDGGPPPAPDPPPQPDTPKPAPAPLSPHSLPPAPTGTLPIPQPAPQPEASPPSFAAWQSSQQRPFMPTLPSRQRGGGSPDGLDAVTRFGRDRCEPDRQRRVDVTYLLFDASGSMSPIRQAQALSCAQQAAQAALVTGGAVVVGTFANGATFTQPTRDLLDVQAALRAAVDPTQTVLPGRQLEPFLDPERIADLVIISDGWFHNARDVLIWYQYFLEINADNRGRMFTVGQPGRREAVSELRNIGFDVYMYEQIGRR